MSKQFAVFGLGRFGGSLVKEFYSLGREVLAVDQNSARVQEYSEYATHSVQANSMDEEALKQLGVRNVDHAFVSLGDDIEGSILTSLLLKELGIKEVWTKAQNDYHQRVLDKIGVNRVIHPERDMAKRIARHISSEKMIDYIELSKKHSMAELVATAKINRKTLMDLNTRAKFGCSIVGIQRNDDLIVSPHPEEMVVKGDILFVIGKNKEISRFEEEGM
ncbi:TrkA family potassium uptake protein [Bacillus sp. FJAT-42376]|uniref:potassium channel family protein n=1 Tax=Bacillus sp. FJAT-42376 TaxID=2014076 RepID=UPI000F4ECEA4|nr:TrkA family potassium uptake protein [Bacillus sp. FJAT-42376]AZB44333.1 TrkA family potassium uptake protein [Bacillus sp. FJAT-42376]